VSSDGNDSPAAGQPHTAGYPLGALFVLVATSAVLAVAIAPLIRVLVKGEVDVSWVIASLIGGAALGAILGGILGLISFGRVLGGLLGSGIGAVIGLVAGLMVHTPPHQLPQVALAMLVGSCAVVVLAFWMRRRE
jgi:hypothetical protein